MTLSIKPRLGPAIIFGGCLAFMGANAGASTHHQNKRHEKVTITKKTTVNINSASASLLSSIKGIGPKRAQAIIAYRKEHGEFNSIDGLSSIKGISSPMIKRWIKLNPGRLVLNKK